MNPNKCTCFFTSSIGKKYFIALTGIGFAGFLLVHLLGNLTLFVSGEMYNKYSYTLLHNPAIILAELALAALFLIHGIMAVWTTLQNYFSRGSRTWMTTKGQKSVSFASRTMVWQGLVILVFTVLHLFTFKYGTVYTVTYDGVEMRDIHRLLVEIFQMPGYVVYYIAAMIFIGFHLSHGVASSVQSLGFNHPRYTPMIKWIGVSYFLLISVGFMTQPIYVYFFTR